MPGKVHIIFPWIPIDRSLTRTNLLQWFLLGKQQVWWHGFRGTVRHERICAKEARLHTYLIDRGYYAVGLPVLALFALDAKRIYIFLGTIAYTVLVAVLILPRRGKFVRNLVNL